MTMHADLEVRRRDGLWLRGEIAGAEHAPLVVLLHGGGQTRNAWARTADRLLRSGFAVACYDARGHGDSDWSRDGDYRMETFADDLLDVLDALGRPAALVGASLGGVSALLVAADAPERVRALVLVDIVPRFAAAGVERIRGFMLANPNGFETLDAAVDAVRAYNPHRPPPRDPRGLLRSLRERDGRLFWHWDPLIIGATPDAALMIRLSERLGAIPRAVPLLLVAGAESDVVDPEALRGFARQAPQAETVLVAQAGHMVAGDRNDAFGEAITDFLKRTSA